MFLSVPPPNAGGEAVARPSRMEVVALFLRLGLTAFGGPAAHIAMMQQEVVDHRKWIEREEFLDLLGAANLIPGPSSTELAIFLGYRLAGAVGLILAGVCFILPAFLMVLGLAWAYVRFQHLPQVGRALYGVKPVIIAIILQALWNLGRTAVKSRLLALIGGIALIPAFWGVSPLIILLGAGLLVGGRRWFQERKTINPLPLLAIASALALYVIVPLLFRRAPAAVEPFGLWPLFWVFLKLGSVIYGSGYVLLAFLRSELVTQRSWLTSARLLDAVAVGQVTPGPVFTTATFIGFVLGGVPGAIAATVGIFLPAFLLVAVGGKLVPRLRSSPLTAAFLDGVNVAALALMAAVTVELARNALIDPITLILAAASAALLLRFRLNTTWLIAAGILVGLVTGHTVH